MAVSYVGAGSRVLAEATDATPGLPAGVAVGDLMLLLDCINHHSGTANEPGTPTGWTKVPGTGASFAINPGNSRHTLYYRRFQSGDTAPTVTYVSSGSGSKHYARIFAFSGAPASGDPFQVIGTAAVNAASSTTAGPIPGVTATAEGLVFVGVQRTEDAGADGNTNGFAVLTGDSLTWTEIEDISSTPVDDVSVAVDYAVLPAGQVITDKTFSVTGTNTGGGSLGQMFVIASGSTAVTHDAAATAAGVGSAAVSATQTHAAASTAAGVGAATASAQQTHLAEASAAGAGAAGATALTEHVGGATAAGVGSATADNSIPAEAVAAGVGSATAGGTLVQAAGAVAAGRGSATATARVDRPPLNISLWAVAVDDSLTPLPGFAKLDFSRERNAVGSLTVDYPAGAAGFSLLRAGVVDDRDVEVEIWLGGKREGALRALLEQTTGDDLDARAVWSFAGGFLERLLAQAIVYHQPPPAEKGELVFSGRNAGQILATVVDQAQARGALAGITRDWTTAVDSTGFAWPKTVSTLKFSPRTTVLQVCEKLVDLDLAEFEVTADRVLKLWAPGQRGVDRTLGNEPSTFRHGRVDGAPIRHSVRESGTVVLVAGADGVHREASDASAQARRGRRIEVGLDANNLADVSAVQAFATQSLTTVTPGQNEIRHGLTFGPGDPRPGAGFDLADKVISERAGGTRLSVDLQQYTLAVTRTRVTGEVVLKDRIASRLERLRRQLDAISSGAAVVGTSTPPDTDDTIPPAAPTGVTVDSLADPVGDGSTVAIVLVGWTAVTTDASGPSSDKARAAELILERMQSGLPIAEDWTWAGAPAVVGAWNDSLLADYEASGSTDAQAWLADYVAANSETGVAADDLAGYRVEWRLASSTAWRLGKDVSGGAAVSTSFSGVAAGASILVRVAAYDTNGNTSAWSAEVAHTTQTDATAPPVPSTPTAFSRLGVLMVEWDGLGSAGEAMPADFDFVEVHMSEASNFTPVAGTYYDRLFAAGTMPVVDQAFGVAKFFKLVAVDRTTPIANFSDASGQATATPSKVVEDDIFAGAVGTLALADLAVKTAKIDDLAVNDAKFGSGSFGKITAGVMSVAMTLTGIIRTATTGLRWEGDSAGVRFYNSSGTNTIRLEGASGNTLITGTLQSGMSGTRWVMHPLGELRLYGNSGTDYARIYNFENGNDVVLRGRLDANNRSGRFNAGPLGCGMNFSSEAEVPDNLRAEIVVDDRRIRTQAPVTTMRINRALTTPDGGTHRIEFFSGDSTVFSIGGSRLEYLYNASGGSGENIQLRAPILDCNIAYRPGVLLVRNTADNAYIPINASAFNVNSSEARKRDIADVGIDRAALRAKVRAVVPKRYKLTSEVDRPAKPGTRSPAYRMVDGERVRDATGRPVLDLVDDEWAAPLPPARDHIGFIAENLREHFPDLVSTDPADPSAFVVDVVGALAVLWKQVSDLVADSEPNQTPQPSRAPEAP